MQASVACAASERGEVDEAQAFRYQRCALVDRALRQLITEGWHGALTVIDWSVEHDGRTVLCSRVETDVPLIREGELHEVIEVSAEEAEELRRLWGLWPEAG